MTLTKGARFGLYAVVTMARHPGERVSAGEVARRFGISENHVAKILQQLARGRIIRSIRGVGGGYELSRDARRLTMLEVVECVAGPQRIQSCGECPLRDQECPADPAACNVHHVLAELASNAYYTMKSVTVATLSGPRQRAEPSVRRTEP